MVMMFRYPCSRLVSHGVVARKMTIAGLAARFHAG
jgi:hypothetical protein